MLSVNSEIIPNNNSFSLPNMRLVIHIKDKKHLTITYINMHMFSTNTNESITFIMQNQGFLQKSSLLNFPLLTVLPFTSRDCTPRPVFPFTALPALFFTACFLTEVLSKAGSPSLGPPSPSWLSWSALPGNRLPFPCRFCNPVRTGDYPR